MRKTAKFYFVFVLTGITLISAPEVQAVPYPFSDDFEAGIVNWSAGGQWGLIESPCLDGGFAVTDSPFGTYPDN